ncbi:MAG: hypothetical protein ACKVS6_05470 [Planctomycetota bacterium]
MKSVHADRAIRLGEIRIGTLYEYRDIEKHNNLIGDDGEGKIERNRFVPGTETWTGDNIPEFARESFKIDPGKSVSWSNLTFVYQEQSENYYLFSASQQMNCSVMKARGYDACIVIRNPSKFFGAISRFIRYKAKYLTCNACIYTDRVSSTEKPQLMHPAFIKPPIYAEQTEVRALWKPHAFPIKPIIIKSFKAVAVCDRVI